MRYQFTELVEFRSDFLYPKREKVGTKSRSSESLSGVDAWRVAAVFALLVSFHYPPFPELLTATFLTGGVRSSALTRDFAGKHFDTTAASLGRCSSRSLSPIALIDAPNLLVFSSSSQCVLAHKMIPNCICLPGIAVLLVV